MRGLLLKTVREVWLGTLLFGLGLMLIKALLTFVLPKAFDGAVMTEIFEQFPFAKTMIAALLGTEVGDRITQKTMQSFLWVHPTVLTLVWTHAIAFCTRFPAGEIDRGTIDILLSWPVSRRKIYLCESIVWVLSGALIILMGFVGFRLVVPEWPEEMRPQNLHIMWIMLNLFCVYLAVGGMAFLVSACSDRRGRAVAIIFTLVLASFLLTFLAQFWDPARQIAFLSVMEYYQPSQILSSGRFPANDISVLLGVGGASWLLAGEVVARRSICTV